jgi:hypothetical protein
MNMAVTEDQKRKMAENLGRSFQLLDTVMNLRLAYLKKSFPHQTEAQLVHKIHQDIVDFKERQWNMEKP